MEYQPMARNGNRSGGPVNHYISNSMPMDLNMQIPLTIMSSDTVGAVSSAPIHDSSHMLNGNAGGETNGQGNFMNVGNQNYKVRDIRDREQWKSRTEFLLTLIGYTIGLGNVWRFPWLCHSNGGASFLIPYGIMLAIEGIPLYYMELCIGQRMRKGAVGVWNEISPYLGGVGLASVMVCFLVSLYYNVIIAWCMFYLINSFQTPLPWSKCPTETIHIGNQTVERSIKQCISPTKYFWYTTTLELSSNIESSGTMNWKLFGCLALMWLLVWFCMMKGIRITGKIVYLTATLPLVILIVFFFRGVHLKGYQEGLALLFDPKFDKLADFKVWMDAAVQIFYSLGVAYGSLIAFASYNPIKNDSTSDAVTVCLTNCAVSIYASVVVFCFIGFQAYNKMEECMADRNEEVLIMLNGTQYVNNNILNWGLKMGEDEINSIIQNYSTSYNVTLTECHKTQFLNDVAQGQGLAFIVFTDVINQMPYASLWSVMFFLMLLMIGIDTEFGMLEGVVTPIVDMKWFPNTSKATISGVLCFVSFVLGLSMVQQSGSYWFQVIDAYCSGIPLLIIALVECIAISYVYGIDRFSDDIAYMTNKPPIFLWKWCWRFISPIAIMLVLFMSIKGLSEKSAMYQTWDHVTQTDVSVPYPPWTEFIAVLLVMSSVSFIPIVAFLKYFRLMNLRSPERPAVLPVPRGPVRRRRTESTRRLIQNGDAGPPKGTQNGSIRSTMVTNGRLLHPGDYSAPPSPML